MDKNSLRTRAIERRRLFISTLDDEGLENISMALVARIMGYFNIPHNCVVATYFPLSCEQSTRLLNFTLQGEGNVIAYPRIEADGHLTFRQVDLTSQLVLGPLGAMEPPKDAPVLNPDLFLVPVVAFDSNCHRLGYGKGCYDRALEAARKEKKVLAIGIAYDMQKVDEISIDPFDQQLDYVATEIQIYKAVKK